MKAKDKLESYERFFHQINTYVICMNHTKISEAINLISNWSYAHRVGNGMNSEKEQQRIVDKVIVQMRDYV